MLLQDVRTYDLSFPDVASFIEECVHFFVCRYDRGIVYPELGWNQLLAVQGTQRHYPDCHMCLNTPR